MFAQLQISCLANPYLQFKLYLLFTCMRPLSMVCCFVACLFYYYDYVFAYGYVQMYTLFILRLVLCYCTSGLWSIMRTRSCLIIRSIVICVTVCVAVSD